MNDFTSGKRNGKDIREANLQPIQPGEVRNPSGANQYTYRRDFERTVDRLLASVATEAQIEEAQIPEHVRRGITA